ncbi:MAG: hypothetical protein WBD27_17425 [Pyrinomonadaceae bacterium]
MKQEATIEAAKAKGPVNYAEKIAGQQALVDRLSDDYKENPSPELELDLKRKTDALLHLKNLIKDDPKARAKKAAQTAKVSTLGKAYA